MTNSQFIIEVALLLLFAFLAGCAIGYLLRRAMFAGTVAATVSPVAATVPAVETPPPVAAATAQPAVPAVAAAVAETPAPAVPPKPAAKRRAPSKATARGGRSAGRRQTLRG